jgi:hypothetical protein
VNVTLQIMIDAIRTGLAERADRRPLARRMGRDRAGALARGDASRGAVHGARGARGSALMQAVIEPNRGDREFFVRKAIGWALRSYAWVDPEAVRTYCDTHELAPLTRREALKNIGK